MMDTKLQNDEEYHLHVDSFQVKEGENLLCDSCEDVPIRELSGDEAIEQSFMVGSLHSSLWGNQKKSSIFLTIVTIIKSILGVGILGLPNVAKNFGLAPTIMILVIFCCLTQFSTILLTKCKNLSKHSNFTSIGYNVFKRKEIIKAINICIILNNFGLTVSELIIFGTTIDNLVGMVHDYPRPWYLSKKFLDIICCIMIFPFVCMKKIEKLKFVGLIALMAIFTFTMVITYHFFDLISQGNTSPSFEWFPSDFNALKAFATLPTVIMAFNWQFNLFPVYKGMANPNDKNLQFVCIVAMTCSTVFYITIAGFGFASFGSQVEADFIGIIKRNGQNGVGTFLYTVLNVSYMTSTALTMPIMFFGARNNFLALLKPNEIRKIQIDVTATNDYNNVKSTEDYKIVRQKSKKNEEIRFYITTLALWTLMATVTVSVDSLELVFNLVGAVSSNAIGGILPCLFYTTLVKRARNNQRWSQKKFVYYFVKTYLVIACFITVFCVSSEFIK